MGTWGSGSFDSDDASDWVWELEEATDWSIVRDALEATADADADDYVEAPDAVCAIAAAEVVAASAGSPCLELPEEVGQWVAAHGSTLTPDLRELAIRGVTRARENSELRELWDEADGAEWLAKTQDLLVRLGST